jgi:hypothetical protein
LHAEALESGPIIFQLQDIFFAENASPRKDLQSVAIGDVFDFGQFLGQNIKVVRRRLLAQQVVEFGVLVLRRQHTRQHKFAVKNDVDCVSDVICLIDCLFFYVFFLDQTVVKFVQMTATLGMKLGNSLQEIY